MRISKVLNTLLLYSFVLLIQGTNSQTVGNPAFLEQIGTYSNVNQVNPDYNSNTFIIAQSQIFQTIYNRTDTDLTQRRSRPIFDFSDACSNQTTLNDLQNWNLNGLNKYIAVNNLEKIALAKRGGCTWMQKVLNIGQLSKTYDLFITHLIIYDNQTYANGVDTRYTTSAASGTTTAPHYDQPLPAITNISTMADNDILANNDNALMLLNNRYIPNHSYFVSNNYGMELIGKIHSFNKNDTSVPNNFLFLQILLQQTNWNNGIIISNYITWIIALGAIFFLASFALFLFFRWWRVRQRNEDREYNIILEEHQLRMLNQSKLKPLPVSIVNSYPIQNYNPDTIKNSSCVICLEDYEENQPDIRILPCEHGFCVLCIDPWLTQKSTLCPICKYNCLPPELQDEKDNDIDDQPTTSSQTNSSHTTTTTISRLTESIDIADMNILSSSSVSPPKGEENVTNATTSSSATTKDSENKKNNDTKPIASTSSSSSNQETLEVEKMEKEKDSSFSQNPKRISHEANLSSSLSSSLPNQIPLPASQPSSTSSSPRHSIEEENKKKKSE